MSDGEIPKVYYYHGENIENLDRDQLLEALRDAAKTNDMLYELWAQAQPSHGAPLIWDVRVVSYEDAEAIRHAAYVASALRLGYK